MDASQVDAELDGVIADDLGPVVYNVYIGFTADPGKEKRSIR